MRIVKRFWRWVFTPRQFPLADCSVEWHSPVDELLEKRLEEMDKPKKS